MQQNNSKIIYKYWTYYFALKENDQKEIEQNTKCLSQDNKIKDSLY